MSSPDEQLNDTQREACAVQAMRAMLEDYAQAHNVPFDQALLSFAASRLYRGLFDYETGLWAEGPTYLMALYEEELSRAGSLS